MAERPGEVNRSFFDSLAVEYDAWFENKGKLAFEIEIKAFDEILPLLTEPWLEVGTGSGRFARELGIETGVDPSIGLLEISMGRGIKTHLAKGEALPFKEGSFGTAFIIVTLCFVESPLAVLRETRRVLKPGGSVVLGLVLRESPWGKFYLQKKLEGHRFYKHATFYSYEETEKLLKNSGFTVSRVISTLFQEPGEVIGMEDPKNGYYSDAGFTIIAAEKTQD
jgi:ubiquinone/menaquinone biosynthesis C-methylase UbiE